MQKRKQHPFAAGVIAALTKKIRKGYVITATGRWQKDGFWIEGTCGTDKFELLADYNENGEIVVQYACWSY